MKILTIFAGYDKDNIIDDYVLFYLKELSKFSDIIYIVDCEMPETELNKIKDYTIRRLAKGMANTILEVINEDVFTQRKIIF